MLNIQKNILKQILVQHLGTLFPHCEFFLQECTNKSIVQYYNKTITINFTWHQYLYLYQKLCFLKFISSKIIFLTELQSSMNSFTTKILSGCAGPNLFFMFCSIEIFCYYFAVLFFKQYLLAIYCWLDTYESLFFI